MLYHQYRQYEFKSSANNIQETRFALVLFKSFTIPFSSHYSGTKKHLGVSQIKAITKGKKPNNNSPLSTMI